MHLQTRGICRVMMLIATASVVMLGLLAGPAGAATTTTAKASPLKPNEILNDVIVGPATVTTPGSPSRTLSAVQTAAFMRTWLGTSINAKLPNQKPSSCLPKSTLRFNNTYVGTTTPTIVFYVSDGTNAWVGMPAQSLGFGSVPSEKWIAAPDVQGTIKAFNAPDPPPSTTIACTSKTPTKPSSDDSSSSTTWVWFAVPAAIIIVGLGIWLVLRSRSRASVA
jgi:hypothetical protein